MVLLFVFFHPCFSIQPQLFCNRIPRARNQDLLVNSPQASILLFLIILSLQDLSHKSQHNEISHSHLLLSNLFSILLSTPFPVSPVPASSPGRNTKQLKHLFFDMPFFSIFVTRWVELFSLLSSPLYPLFRRPPIVLGASLMCESIHRFVEIHFLFFFFFVFFCFFSFFFL